MNCVGVLLVGWAGYGVGIRMMSRQSLVEIVSRKAAEIEGTCTLSTSWTSPGKEPTVSSRRQPAWLAIGMMT